jgi:hypothetical protein
MRRDQLERLVVTDGTSQCDHHRAGVIVRFEELAHVVGVDGLDRVAITGRLAAEGVVGEQLRCEHAVGDVVG